MRSKTPVFIAHHHADAETALALVAMLDYAFDRRLNTFCSSKPSDKIRDVTPIPPYRDKVPLMFAIEDAMGPADYVVVLHTPKALGSEWVQFEADMALFSGRQGRRTAICLARGACWGDHYYHRTHDVVFDLSYGPSALLFLEDVAKWLRAPLMSSGVDPYLKPFKAD
jgi:hypothetical protein